jgi:hypothetical protein
VTFNPYSPPQTDTEQRAPAANDAKQLELAASGQRMVIRAFLLYFAVIGCSGAFGKLLPPVVLGFGVLAGVAAILVLSLVGVLRLSSGLGVRMPFRILIGVFIFVPILNLLVLGVLSGKATRVLRKAGYSVGLLGARKPA